MTDDATTRTIPHPVPDPELIPPALDLSHPELTELMDRYQTRSVAAPAVRRPVALLVRRPGLPTYSLKEALTDEGWAVETCDGPGVSACPLMIGEPCDLRESADIAVVYVDRRAPSTVTSALPRLRCASHVASPSIIAVEASIESPTFTDHSAVVGGLRDPRTIIGAIRRLLVKVRSR